MAQWEHRPALTHLYTFQKIDTGRPNHNCDISNSTIPFYSVIFLLYLLQMSFVTVLT